MKIGGLTWWRNNYGSILQALALQAEIEQKTNVEYEIVCQFGRSPSSIKNLYDKLKRFGFKETIIRIFWKFCFPQVNKRRVAIQKFVEENLHISNRVFLEDEIYEANKYYDGFICGSDQVWNLELVPLDSLYWLGFADHEKLKISYAPSIGVDNITKEQREKIRRNLEGFKAISCREESGAKLINEAIGKEVCKTVLDPTLLIGKGFWERICPLRKFTNPYIFVYLLRGTKQQRKLVEEFAKLMKLDIVTIPLLETDNIVLYDFKFGNIKYWDADPVGFIGAIKYADFVFTDSFHSTVFSILYHKTFYIFPKSGGSQMSRLLNIQHLLGISDRMINQEMSVEDILRFADINWQSVDEILKIKREESEDYLMKALEY